MDGPPLRSVTDEHRRAWTRSAANARRRALDLANGLGIIGDPEDEVRLDQHWSLPKAGANDDRRQPLVWEEDYCLIYVEPQDGLASYGRHPHPVDCKFLPRKIAVHQFGKDWDKYQHFGNVPRMKEFGYAYTKAPRRAAPAVAMPTIALPMPERPITLDPADTGLTSTHGAALRDGRITEQQYKQAQDMADWLKARAKFVLPTLDYDPTELPPAEACAARDGTGPIRMWLIDTGCGHDLVARRELKGLKRLIRQAGIPLNFSTANGEVPASECADLFVKELNETVEPYVLESTPAVLSVGMRCMKMGYSFIWPTGENPYFITPSGQIVELEVHDDIPYITSGSRTSRPRNPTKRRKFAAPGRAAAPSKEEAAESIPDNCGKPPAEDCSCSAGCRMHREFWDFCVERRRLAAEARAAREQAGAPPPPAPAPADASTDDVPPPPAPYADDGPDVLRMTADAEEQDGEPDPETMTPQEADSKLPETVRSRLRREAQTLKHKLLHKPKNPYCDACNRAKMRRGKLFKGSYNRKPEQWGWCITCDHIVSQKDNMLGITGSRDCLTIKDLWSKLKHCYPTEDKSTEETVRCMKHFIGDRKVRRVYSDNSGEIGKALKELGIMPETSQPGRHENNAII